MPLRAHTSTKAIVLSPHVEEGACLSGPALTNRQSHNPLGGGHNLIQYYYCSIFSHSLCTVGFLSCVSGEPGVKSSVITLTALSLYLMSLGVDLCITSVISLLVHFLCENHSEASQCLFPLI